MFHYWTQTVDSLASAVLISFTLSYSVLHSDVPTYVCIGVLKYEEHQTAFKLLQAFTCNVPTLNTPGHHNDHTGINVK